MNKHNVSSPLSGVSFEDIIAEDDASATNANQGVSTDGKSVSKRNSRSTSSVEFRIINNYGKLSTKKNAVTFALVDWDGYQRYDLRSWNEDYTVPYKGISFTEEEIAVLSDAFSCYTHQVYSEPRYVCDMGKTKAKIYYSICKLSSSTVRGVLWHKQVSIVDWGYGQKFDFRKWTESYDKCSKGVCLNVDEVNALSALIATI